MIYLNRSPAIRAIVAQSVAALDRAMPVVAPNVLVVDAESLSMSQVKNIVVRFVKAPRPNADAIAKELNELAAGPCVGGAK